MIRPEWQWDAACRDCDPDLFFPAAVGGAARGKSQQAQIAEAKAVCARCPVEAQCLAYALEHHIAHGIWGRTTGQERRKLQRLRHGDPCCHLDCWRPAQHRGLCAHHWQELFR